MELDEECRRDPAIEVWSCNAKSVRLFTALDTSWHVGPTGPIGLNFVEASHIARTLKIRWTAERFGDMKVMERAALAALRERRDA